MTGRKKETRGDRLAALRTARKLSAAELARRSGFSKSIVSLWEANRRELSGSDRLYDGLGRAFEVSPSTLRRYLDGEVELATMLEEGPLDQALQLNRGQWCDVTIATARELETQMTKSQARSRNPATWVHQLTELEREFRASIKTRLERLLDDDLDFLDEAHAASTSKGSRRSR